jgi:cold shock CspA family protein
VKAYPDYRSVNFPKLWQFSRDIDAIINIVFGKKTNMTASKFIGKIDTLVTRDNRQFGYISCTSNFENHSGDIGFNDSDLINADFSELSKGNIVGFDVETITKKDGSDLLVARRVKSKIVGSIESVCISNPDRQFFWCNIKPEADNFLSTQRSIILLSQHLKQKDIMNQLKKNKKVEFTVEENKGENRSYGYRVKSITSLTLEQLTETSTSVPPTTETIKDSLFNTISVPPTIKTIKDSLFNTLQEIENIKSHAEFEDLVFLILRMLGIHKLYQYSRHNAAGRADGIFVSGNLVVIYDCTLMQDFDIPKGDQLNNYIDQISRDSFTINKNNRHTDEIEHIIKMPENRQVWVITNDLITQRKSRVLRKVDGIWIKEVSIQSLIALFLKRLNSPTFEEETLADRLRMIESI